MADSIHDKLQHVTAREVAEALDGKHQLSSEALSAADVNGDGRVDVEDVEMLAREQLRLANKISGAIVGMEGLTEDERRVAERNGDGHINLTDSYRLADDARDARSTAARLKRQP